MKLYTRVLERTIDKSPAIVRFLNQVLYSQNQSTKKPFRAFVFDCQSAIFITENKLNDFLLAHIALGSLQLAKLMESA